MLARGWERRCELGRWCAGARERGWRCNLVIEAAQAIRTALIAPGRQKSMAGRHVPRVSSLLAGGGAAGSVGAAASSPRNGQVPHQGAGRHAGERLDPLAAHPSRPCTRTACRRAISTTVAIEPPIASQPPCRHSAATAAHLPPLPPLCCHRRPPAAPAAASQALRRSPCGARARWASWRPHPCTHA